jgi:N-acetyl-anhydromuramoyl-L-alanine amidase
MKFPEIWRPSPNYADTPPHTREGVVLHHTVLSFEETLARLLDPSSRVSYHAVIAPNGERCALVRDEQIAWHAGVSAFQGRPDCNRFLLGLAFAGDTYRVPLTAAQIASAEEWLGVRWKKYSWSLSGITDHRQIAPERKNDLNPTEWERIRTRLGESFPAG